MTAKRKAAAGPNAAVADDNDAQSAKRRKVEVCRIGIESCRICLCGLVDVVVG